MQLPCAALIPDEQLQQAAAACRAVLPELQADGADPDAVRSRRKLRQLAGFAQGFWDGLGDFVRGNAEELAAPAAEPGLPTAPAYRASRPRHSSTISSGRIVPSLM